MTAPANIVAPEPVPLRAIVVDDEPLARLVLQQMLSRDVAIDVVATCASGEEAIDAVAQYRPDVLFLDIRMPGCDGLTVVERLGSGESPYSELPYIVFVTAYDRYAIDAFRLRAVDYVLKPVQPSRLREAVSRARELKVTRLRASQSLMAPTLSPVQSSALASAPAFARTLLVRSGIRDLVIPVESIDWIEADAYYSRLHVEKRSHLMRERMHVLEARLDPQMFARVHRSAIVNVGRVQEMRHEARGRHVIVLSTGARIRASRPRWMEFAALMRGRAM